MPHVTDMFTCLPIKQWRFLRVKYTCSILLTFQIETYVRCIHDTDCHWIFGVRNTYEGRRRREAHDGVFVAVQWIGPTPDVVTLRAAMHVATQQNKHDKKPMLNCF